MFSIVRVVCGVLVGGGVWSVAHASAAPSPRNPVQPSVRAFEGAGGSEGVLYVDASAAGPGDGLSWATAYPDLQQALADASVDLQIDQIRVAQGTYYPDNGTGSRGAAFVLRSGLELIGGFPAGGADAPDPDVFVSLLSGDLDQNDPIVDDNSFNVVVGSGVDATAVIDGFFVVGGNSTLGGGGLFSANGAPMVRNVTFQSCRTSLSGGAVYLANTLGLATFESCTFHANTAPKLGGAIYAQDAPLQLVDCEFRFNAAGSEVTSGFDVGRGGAVYVTSGQLSVTGCEFHGNEARNSNDPLGGAVYTFSADPLVYTDSTFTLNRTRNATQLDGSGGAIHAADSGLVLNGCSFAFNESQLGGGVFYPSNSLDLNSITTQAVDCVFERNIASSTGGGLYIVDGFWTLTRCGFDFNEAETGEGGGLQAQSASLRMFECAFTGNFAEDRGGGARFSVSPSLDSCVFEANESLLGGGMYATGNATVVGTAFRNNVASQNGGGAWHSSSTRFEDCLFEGNDAFLRGGGSVVSTGTNAVYERCTFVGNTARDGAAIAHDSVSGTVGAITALNCRFVQNVADSDGGGIYGFRDDNPRSVVAGCEFIGNSASRGGAVADYRGDVVNCSIVGNSAASVGGLEALQGSAVSNSIFWDNTDTLSGPGTEAAQIFLLEPAIQYCIVQGLQLFAGANNSGDDPLFSDPLGGDGVLWSGDEQARLTDASPAVNAGLNGTVPAQLVFDILGVNRIAPFGDGGEFVVDAGAYEVQDCNGNGVSDDKDIADGVASDCNANGVPDTCDGPDCDGNGVLDECDIASGSGTDCNNNLVLDVCDSGTDLFVFDSSEQRPFDGSNAGMWLVPAAGRARLAVSLTVFANGDLGSSSENAEVFINGEFYSTIFTSSVDCSNTSQTLSIPRLEFNEAAEQNGGFLEIEVRPSASVSGCESSFGRIRVTQPIEPLTDCDGNGQLDYCEIIADPGLDKDGTGVLDVCEIPCPADIDGNGMVNLDDVDTFVLFFIAQAPQADLNDDGAINFDDIDVFVASFLAGCG